MSQDAIEALGDPDGGWTRREAAALRYADQVARDPSGVSDAVWSELADHFDDGQVVELTAVVGLFSMFNRLTEPLQIESTDPGWPGAGPSPAREV